MSYIPLMIPVKRLQYDCPILYLRAAGSHDYATGADGRIGQHWEATRAPVGGHTAEAASREAVFFVAGTAQPAGGPEALNPGGRGLRPLAMDSL
jgi:hypothetical protein